MFVSRAGPPSKGLGAAFRSRLARCLTWTAKLTFEAFGNVPNWTRTQRGHADQARDFRSCQALRKWSAAIEICRSPWAFSAH